MNNNWIKPSQLPEGFWLECFVANRSSYFTLLRPEIKMLKKQGGKVFIYLDYDEDRGWLELEADSDEITRVMVIERPTITEDDFK